MALNLERVATLLQVAELAAKFGNLQGILGLANDELVEQNKEALKTLEEKRKKEEEERQKKFAELRAKEEEEKKSAESEEPAHAVGGRRA